MGQMRPSANYRLLRPEESAAVAELAKQVFDEFVAPLYSTEGIAEFHRYSDPVEFDARNRADHLTLVAECGEEIVGMLQLRQFRRVSMLFVRRDCQRCGIATRTPQYGCRTLPETLTATSRAYGQIQSQRSACLCPNRFSGNGNRTL